MTEYHGPEDNRETRPQGRGRVLGVVLIIIGCFLLAAQFLDARLVGLLVLPLLGILFIAVGLVERRKWFGVPGGVLLGIGLGVIVSQEVLGHLGQPATAGVFLVCFALGWVVASAMSRAAGGRAARWLLIPGVVLAAVGIPLILARTAPEVVEWIATYWPALLIVAGILLILRTKDG